MIGHVRTVGFKGFDIDEDIPQKALYSGRNMSGKSTRAAAIALTLYGYIPFSTAGKQPGDILESFGGDSLVVSVTIGETEFARKFSRSEKGTVSQTVQVNGKKQAKDNFAFLLNKAGAPKIADVAEFMKQSDAKKVDTLFDLFPNDSLNKIDGEIEQAKEDVSRLEKKKTGAESTVQHLTKSKQEIEIPAGNIAETQDEMNRVEIQIVELAEQIKQAEIAEAKEKAKEDARVEAEKESKAKIAKAKEDGRIEGELLEKERAEREAAEKKEEVVEADPPRTEAEWKEAGVDSLPDSPAMAELDKTITGMEQQVERFKEGKPGEIQEDFLPDENFTPAEAIINEAKAIGSIQRIIEALVGSGCGTCAALIVAKQELKKYGGSQ